MNEAEIKKALKEIEKCLALVREMREALKRPDPFVPPTKRPRPELGEEE